MRLAFTIIFNGAHHLRHNDHLDKLAPYFDSWVFVEGLALPSGSTAWCNNVLGKYDRNGESTDDTIDYLRKKSKEYKSISILGQFQRPWDNKDAQVNEAISAFKHKGIYKGMLWQIDADEQWTPEQLTIAEMELKSAGAKTGLFHSNYFVGKDLIAKGEWGEGINNEYRRLWDWKGEEFFTHEPPRLDGHNEPSVIIPVKFDHYAYYFDVDVRFKNDYYSGHENIYENWLALQKETKFPVHVSKLISGYWGRSNTWIHKDGT
jgi:hypothetical protein